jgi:antitoxin component of RelBE/YafQ-DinJ toxin-antitoxin module
MRNCARPRAIDSLTELPIPAAVVFLSGNTVGVAKFAISVPAETMTQVDRAAKRLGMTRSRYIATVLARVAVRERDASISKRIDEVLAELDEQDLASADHLRAARRDEGTEW